MAALPYIQIYVADYLADAAHLSTLEHGAYLLLIFNYWQRGESIKAKDQRGLNDRLARITRLSDEQWAKVRGSLEEFFCVSETEWSHARIERDLEFVRGKSVKASEAGKASAAKRTRKPKLRALEGGRSTSAQRTLNQTDTETDTDTPTTGVVGAAAPAAPAPQEARNRPIPNNWSPDSETMAHLAQMNIPEMFVYDLVPEFVLYWRERGTPALTWSSKFYRHAIAKWREFEASPPAPPAQRMPAQWMPNEETVAALEGEGIHWAFVASLVPEFVIFWNENQRAHGSWNAKFLNHVRHQWASRLQAKPRSTRDIPLDEQLRDRTWANPADSTPGDGY